MAGLAAEGALCASRQKNKALNGLKVNHVSLNKKSLWVFFFIIIANGTPLEDKVAVSESQAGCFAYKDGSPAFLPSARGTSMTPACDVLPHRSERLFCVLVVL